ncbi:MAG: hypothetical protein IJM15_01510, partial [Erysipelotrichaceae bacterium]|nr:hypothetical protein [Erysipelotrichaceae bacterium]
VKNYRKIWMDNTLKGTSIVSFANSIWLNEGYSLKKNTIQKIATEFFAPVFEGNPGTAEFEKAFKDWLNDNTGNMLQQQVNDIPFDGGIVMALASTIYYKSSYLQNYVKNTEPTVFHGHKGDDEVLMMSKSLTTQYLYGSLFSGYIDHLGNEEMLMILPDENVTFSQLLEDPAFLGIAFEGKKDSVIEARVNATVPAFDVTSKFDLKDILMSMGITGIFGDDPTAFTPVTDDSLFVDFMEHACRFKSDESGVEAAAYTVETMKVTSAHPQGPVYTLVFDRPFIFIIRSKLDNTILFCGVINNA